jgi:hypothetical protein
MGKVGGQARACQPRSTERHATPQPRARSFQIASIDRIRVDPRAAGCRPHEPPKPGDLGESARRPAAVARDPRARSPRTPRGTRAQSHQVSVVSLRTHGLPRASAVTLCVLATVSPHDDVAIAALVDARIAIPPVSGSGGVRCTSGAANLYPFSISHIPAFRGRFHRNPGRVRGTPRTRRVPPGPFVRQWFGQAAGGARGPWKARNGQ